MQIWRLAERYVIYIYDISRLRVKPLQICEMSNITSVIPKVMYNVCCVI